MALLEKLISSDLVVDDKKPTLASRSDSETSDLIRNPQEKLGLLTRVFKSHQLLTVELETYEKQLSSLILEVNEEENYLVLDEFYPTPNGLIINPEDKVKFYTNLSGVEVDFISTIEAISENISEPYYKVPVPKIIKYHQHRKYLRVPVSIGNPLKVVFSDKKDIIINGEIRDLSAGGFSARLKSNEQPFSVGDIIPRCIIYMPKGVKIYCAVEIRQIFLSTDNNTPKIGVQFRDLEASDQREISKYVMQIDRDIIRRIKR